MSHHHLPDFTLRSPLMDYCFLTFKVGGKEWGKRVENGEFPIIDLFYYLLSYYFVRFVVLVKDVISLLAFIVSNVMAFF